MKSILKFVLAFFVVIMLTSCGSYFVVRVDAYGDDSYLENKKALYAKGYIETANIPDADLMVFLRYGISDPKTAVPKVGFQPRT